MTSQNSVFINPENCGSSVGYYLVINDYESKKDNKTTYSVSGTVVLTDCSHKIDWAFNEGDVAKIDAAIGMLQEFRKKYLDAEKQVARLNRGDR